MVATLGLALFVLKPHDVLVLRVQFRFKQSNVVRQRSYSVLQQFVLGRLSLFVQFVFDFGRKGMVFDAGGRVGRRFMSDLKKIGQRHGCVVVQLLFEFGLLDLSFGFWSLNDNRCDGGG